jgi:hypothetical protein
MKWRLSVHGAIVVMAIGVSSVAVAQPRANDGTTLSQLTAMKVATERTAGFRQSLFTGAANRSIPVLSAANVVTVREAWESGAWAWSASKRRSFINDRADVSVLALVIAASSQQRGDKDPAGWMPSTNANTCAYLSNWVSVKTKWGLAMDQRELTAVKSAFVRQCTTPATSSSVPSPAANINKTPSVSITTTTTTTTTAKPVVVGSALALLQTIRVENEYQVGYDRTLFDHWRDIDGDGCDSRDQVLKRDSVSLPQVDPVNCNVVAGDWISPYDGARWSNPSDIDIDHVVALKEAWDSGAWAWSAAQRKAFANDTSDSRTLLAVTDSVNQSKSDKDPSNWLPPLQSYTCTYLGNWIAVKVRWNLSMDSSEFGRIKNLLQSTCVSLDIAPIPNLPSISGGTTVVTNPASSITNSTSTPNTSSSGAAAQINPGSYCSPEGAIGYYTLSGSTSPTTYVCSKTDASGVPYSGGRARWRRA